MRTTMASLASLVALGALTLPAQAQNVVNSAESQQIYWVSHGDGQYWAAGGFQATGE
jgi:uncharacterized membrane protein